MSKLAPNADKWDKVYDMYCEGATDVEVAKELDITIQRFYQLNEEVPAFSVFVDRGRTASQAWWFVQARKGLWDKAFNTTLWNFVAKNRFGWADKIDTSDITDKDPVDLDALKGQLASALKVLAKKNPELLSGANLQKPSPAESEDD